MLLGGGMKRRPQPDIGMSALVVGTPVCRPGVRPAEYAVDALRRTPEAGRRDGDRRAEENMNLFDDVPVAGVTTYVLHTSSPSNRRGTS